MQLCTGSVKEVLNHTLSDVVISGAGGSFACFPSDRAKLFAVPSSFSLCSSAFINGVLLGGGTCDASFVIHALRFKFLATAARPVIQCGGTADAPTQDVCIGIDPWSMSVVVLLAQLLVEQIRISFEVQERSQICQFGSRFPAGGGLWADLAAAENAQSPDCLGNQVLPPTNGEVGTGTPASLTACSPPALYAVVQNGFPHHDNVYTLDQAIGVGNGQSVGAVVEFDTITKADGTCCSVLDLLACGGNTSASCGIDSTACPSCDFAGLLIKADFQVDGLLCRAVC